MGQLFSMGIAVVIVYLLFYISTKNEFDYKTDILLVFFLSFNGLNYIESLAYPLVPIVSFTVYCCFRRNHINKAYWKNFFFAGCLYLAANVSILYKFLHVFIRLNKGNNGWPRDLATLLDISGISVLYNFLPMSLDIALVVVVNCLLFFVLARQIKKEGAASFLAINLYSNFLLYILFCLLYFKQGEVSSYKAYKAAISLSYVVIILFIRFLDEYMNLFWETLPKLRDDYKDGHLGNLLRNLRGEKSFAVVWVFFWFFSVNAAGSYEDFLKPIFRGNFYHEITRDHEVLGSFARDADHDGADFILDCRGSWWNQMMAEYYAPLGRVYTNSYIGYSQRVMKDSIKVGDLYIIEAYNRGKFVWDMQLLFENNIYRVFKIEGESVLLYSNSGMESQMFAGGLKRVGKLEEKIIDFKFLTPRDHAGSISIKFITNDAHAAKPLIIHAYVNGEKVDEFILADENLLVELTDIILKAGINDVSFEFEGDVSDTWVTDLNVTA
jgi:hypothetical protein